MASTTLAQTNPPIHARHRAELGYLADLALLVIAVLVIWVMKRRSARKHSSCEPGHPSAPRAHRS